MKISAGLVALSISALRDGNYDEAAAFLSQAADAPDVSELMTDLTDGNEFAHSLSQSISSDVADLKTVIASLSSSLASARHQELLSDPYEEGVLSVADDDEDDEDDVTGMGIIDFEDDEDEDDDASSVSSSSVSSPITIEFT